MEQFWAGVIMAMGVLEFALAVWVLAKDPKSRIHHFFSLFSLSLAGWTFCNGIELLIYNDFSINGWDRILFFSALAASFFLLQFGQEYPYPNRKSTINFVSWPIFVLVVFFLFFSDLIIARPVEKTLANQQKYYFLYIIVFMVNWILALWFLFRSWQKSVGPIKTQVKLLLLALLLGSVVGIITSFILPFQDVIPPISQLWAPGFAFIIFLFSIKVLQIAYAKNS